MGKVSLFHPESGELWMQDKIIYIFSADHEESLKDFEEGRDIVWFFFWCYWSESQSRKKSGREGTIVGGYYNITDKTAWGLTKGHIYNRIERRYYGVEK